MTATKPRRGSGDDGIAIVEAALMTPVFFLLIFAVFEGGLLFRTYLTVGDMTADGALAGAIQGDDMAVVDLGSGPVEVNGDYSVVAAIREASSAVPVDDIEQIVIFRSHPADTRPPVDQVPNVCKGGLTSETQKCNAYPPREAFLAVQDGDIPYFECTAGVGRSCGWDPGSRKDGPLVSDIEYLGLYIRANRPNITGVLGESTTIERGAILRLEPGSAE